MTPELLDKDPTAAINRSNNPNDPLYWLKRNLETYFDRENNRYFIPVTEYGGAGSDDRIVPTHDKTRMAFDLSTRRTSYFPTDIFMEPGDEIAITVDALDNPQTNCFTVTGTYYPYIELNSMALVEHQTVIYTATTSGPLMLACINNNRDMKSWGKRIKITAVPKNETKKVPIFVFGLNSQKEWRENISQNPNSLNQVMMMSGRDRIYILGDVAKKLPLNIGKLLSEYLLISTAYDKLNGFDSSKAFHFPTQNLQVVTFERGDYVTANVVAVCNDPNRRKSRTEFVDWHELGHAHTMGWSWGSESEVTANIYEMVAERLFKGKQDKFGSYEISRASIFRLDDPEYGNDRFWDPKSVPNFINAKVDPSVLQGGFDAMSSKTYDFRTSIEKPGHVNNEFIRLLMFLQLLFSYGDDFYAKLGKAYREAWNYGDSGNLFDTNQKDKDWFVLNASRASGRDLREFFDLWGLGYSQNVRDAIGAMKLPSPLDDKVIVGGSGTDTGYGGSEGTITVDKSYGVTSVAYTRSGRTIKVYEYSDGDIMVYEEPEGIKSYYKPSQGTIPGSGGTITVDKRGGTTNIVYKRSGKTFTFYQDSQGTIKVSEEPEGITTVYKSDGGTNTDTGSGTGGDVGTTTGTDTGYGGSEGTITVDKSYGVTSVAYTRSGRTIKVYEYSDGDLIVYEEPEGIRSDYNPSQGTMPGSGGTITVDKRGGTTNIVYKRSGKTIKVYEDSETIKVYEEPEGITTVYKSDAGTTTDTGSGTGDHGGTTTGTDTGYGGSEGTIIVDKSYERTAIAYTRSGRTIKVYEYSDGDLIVYEEPEGIRSDYKRSQGTMPGSGVTLTVDKRGGTTNIVYKRSGKTFTFYQDSQGTIKVSEEPEGITTVYKRDEITNTGFGGY
ncbi:M60 family metallopeptidase [Candidatus Rhabdochlamydia oedothoracis]|uniref:M60 family metallopeptidase n=1 Tax=Candidatus Rhabdochlamydia oedothoracis TaxID=2720720 RepID=UPI001C653006|nr:M60 family metallopeptidase [Candidatus Rhabdochlamydia oedothoracis]